MNETKQAQHTPGPWGFGNVGEGRKMILGKNGEGRYVCNVQIWQTPRAMGMYDEPEREANARLIAAAPELLGELQEIVEGWTAIEQGKVKLRRLTAWEEERLEYAREAIAKATGAQS